MFFLNERFTGNLNLMKTLRKKKRKWKKKDNESWKEDLKECEAYLGDEGEVHHQDGDDFLENEIEDEIVIATVTEIVVGVVAVLHQDATDVNI